MSQASKPEKILAAYVLLVTCARTRSTITYGLLAESLDTFALDIGRDYLDPIADYCRSKQLPNLTTLIVAVVTGEPSWDFGPTLYKQREAVYGFKWSSLRLPAVADLIPHHTGAGAEGVGDS